MIWLFWNSVVDSLALTIFYRASTPVNIGKSGYKNKDLDPSLHYRHTNMA